MKKFFRAALVVLALVMGAVAMVGCGGEKDIVVVIREDGSGTRSAFEELITKDDVELGDAKLVSTAVEQKTTGTAMSAVASTKTAIGYVSLGSVDDSVKTLKINGVTPSAENVLNKTYSLWRPFVIMTKKGVESTPAVADFIKFLQSKQAQEIVLEHGYVQQIDENTPDYVVPEDLTEIEAGTVNLWGSSSVQPLMVGDNTKTGMIAAYLELTNLPEGHFQVSCNGSGEGISKVKADDNGEVIGLSSAALSATDAAEIDNFNIALDAVAIVVHPDNELEDITIEQIFDIYTGAITKFSTLLPAEEVDA